MTDRARSVLQKGLAVLVLVLAVAAWIGLRIVVNVVTVMAWIVTGILAVLADHLGDTDASLALDMAACAA